MLTILSYRFAEQTGNTGSPKTPRMLYLLRCNFYHLSCVYHLFVCKRIWYKQMDILNKLHVTASRVGVSATRPPWNSWYRCRFSHRHECLTYLWLAVVHRWEFVASIGSFANPPGGTLHIYTYFAYDTNLNRNFVHGTTDECNLIRVIKNTHRARTPHHTQR